MAKCRGSAFRTANSYAYKPQNNRTLQIWRIKYRPKWYPASCNYQDPGLKSLLITLDIKVRDMCGNKLNLLLKCQNTKVNACVYQSNGVYGLIEIIMRNICYEDCVSIYCLDYTSKLYSNDADRHCKTSYTTYIKTRCWAKVGIISII